MNTRLRLSLPLMLAACTSSTFHVIRLVDGEKQSPLGGDAVGERNQQSPLGGVAVGERNQQSPLGGDAVGEKNQRASLEVVNVSTSVREPFIVHGSDVAYDDLDLALRDAVTQAAKQPRFAPFRIALEITDAKADFTDGRLSVRLTTRATLRARADNAYVSQTQQVCSASDVIDPAHGTPVVADCLQQLARDLESWLTRSTSNPTQRSP